MKTYIYALCHPITSEVRYIGKSIEPDKRLKDHIKISNKPTTYRQKWINSLRPLIPELLILEEVDGEDWPTAEEFWIMYFRFLGARLANHSNGGEGSPGVSKSEETRKKIGLAQLGKKRGPYSPEHCANISKGQMGRKLSSEHIEKIRANQVGKPLTDAARRKISEKLKGRPKTKEHAMKVGAARKGVPHTPEAIEKMRESHRKRHSVKIA